MCLRVPVCERGAVERTPKNGYPSREGAMCRMVYSNKSDKQTQRKYRTLFKYVAPQLNDLQPTIIFQQDGAPPHWGLHVCGFLNETFPDRWIGRDGPIPWPPRSPDITTLDFFLWGYVNDIVYRTQVRDITDLKQRIINAIATIDEAMLQRTWLEIDYRLDVLRATNGAHVEVY